MFSFVANDDASVLSITCRDRNGVAIDLTTALAVRLYYRIDGGSLQTKTMVIDPDQVANTGVASYRWLSAELIAGKMVAEVEITDASSNVLTSNRTLTYLIRERL